MKKIYAFGLALLASIMFSHAATITGTCGENLNWSIDTKAKVLTITGSGEMVMGEYGQQPWEEYREYIATVNLPEGLTNIASWAFSECGALTSIEIPNSVEYIGEYAFSWCSSLTSVKTGDGVTSIWDRAFEYCYALSSVTLGKNVKGIWNYSFYSCRELSSITFPEGMTDIGYQTFYYCDKLTSIVIPNTVTNIGAGAFYYCSALSSVTLSNNLSTISNDLFNSCRNLTSITIPNSVSSIGSSAFSYCDNLGHVNIGSGVTTIGEGAFNYCEKLHKLTVLATEPPSNAQYSGLYHKTCALFVPAQSISIYDDVYWWEEFASIRSLEEDNGFFASCKYGAYSIAGCAYDPLTDEYFAVAGWCDGLFWKFNGCALDLVANNKFSKTFNLPAGTYQFKITTYSNDGEEEWYGYDWSSKHDENAPLACENHVYFEMETYPNSDETNCMFSISEADQVKITYDCGENLVRVERLHSAGTPSTATRFEVKFLDWDGTELKKDSVDLGKAAVAPANPTREGYTFTGWNADFSNITADLVVTAQYTSNASGVSCEYSAYYIAGAGYDEEEDEQYAVEGWCDGKKWVFNGCQLNPTANNTYSKTFYLPAGAYEFKVTAGEDSWFGTNEYEIMVCDNYVAYSTSTYLYAENCKFSISEQDSVRVTFNCEKERVLVERLHYNPNARKYYYDNVYKEDCRGNKVLINGTYYEEDAIVTETIVSTTTLVDTIRTTSIHFLPTYDLTIAVSIAESQLPYEWEGLTFTEAGSKTRSLTTVNGCDSTVTLQLTVVQDGWDPEHPQNPGNYQLSLTAEPADMGVVNGAGLYAQGTTVDISAVANEGHYFVKWSDNNTSATRSILLNRDVELTAYFAVNYYSITFVNYDGAQLQKTDEAYGTMPVYSGKEPTRPDTKYYSYSFAGWKPAIKIVSEDAVYTAQYDSVLLGLDTVIVSGFEDIADLAVGAMTHIIVEEGAVLNVSQPTTAATLTLRMGSACAQVNNISNLAVSAADMVLSWPVSNADSRWFAFAVPFEVSVAQGIRVEGAASPATYGLEFVIDEYDGALRASSQDGWKRVESSAILYPGRMYMLAANGNTKSWRMTARNTNLNNSNSVTVAAYPSSVGDHHAGWNGIANPLWTNAYASMKNVRYGTIYNNKLGVYEVVLLDEHPFHPAEPVFIQVPNKGSVLFASANEGVQGKAPIRMELYAENELTYTLKLAAQNGAYSDKAYITMSSTKENRYVVGHDLVKMESKAANVPQLWFDQYGLRLAVYEAVWDDAAANIQMGIYAPEDGSYLLEIKDVPDDADLYLTYQGNAIWDLTSSEIKLDLKKGYNEDFGIVLQDISEATEVISGNNNNNQKAAKKVLVNGQLYIVMPDGQAYTVTGINAR